MGNIGSNQNRHDVGGQFTDILYGIDGPEQRYDDVERKRAQRLTATAAIIHTAAEWLDKVPTSGVLPPEAAPPTSEPDPLDDDQEIKLPIAA